MNADRGLWIILVAYTFGVTNAAAQSAARASQSQNSQPSAVQNDAESAHLEEIVVTAERRPERLTDVPSTVDVVSADSLASADLTDLRDLSLAVPGLLMERTGSNVNPIIRGVGSSITEPGSDTNVAIYIDGVVQPIPSANAIELNNIERIEVLEGPQGTLYGRNATGGAISIITRTPSFTPGAEGQLGYGSFGELRSNLYGTTGLTSNIAADIALDYKGDGGYIKNVTTGEELGVNSSFSARTKFLFNLSDTTSAVLSYAHTDRFDSDAVTYNVLNNNTAALHYDPNTLIETSRYAVAVNVNPFVRTKSDQVAVNAKWTSGSTTINSITSYSLYHGEVLYDGDGTPVNLLAIDFPTSDKIFTQDVNLNTQLLSDLELLTGVSYYNGNSYWFTHVYSFSLITPFYNLRTGNVTNAEAAFAQFTYHATPRLTFVAGARYSTEAKTSYGYTNFGQSLDESVTFVGWSPSASIRYALSDTTNAYVSYSRGFKSGLIDVVALNPTPVKPETNDALEVGLKHASGPISYSVAAYNYWYKNIQVESFSATDGLTAVQNAAKAGIYGLEGNATAIVARDWKLNGGISYNHARFDQFPNASVFTPLPGGGNAESTQNVSGDKLPRAPDFTANASLLFDERTGVGTFEPSISGLYNGGFSWDSNNRLNQSSYFVLNAKFSWISTNGRYEVSLWGDNLTNAKYSVQTTESATGDFILYARPVSVGILLTGKLR